MEGVNDDKGNCETNNMGVLFEPEEMPKSVIDVTLHEKNQKITIWKINAYIHEEDPPAAPEQEAPVAWSLHPAVGPIGKGKSYLIYVDGADEDAYKNMKADKKFVKGKAFDNIVT